MAFYPEIGTWTQEDFSDPNGTILSSFQTVTGGFFAMKPNQSGVRNYSTRWSNINSWNVNSNLNTFSIISGTFTRETGVCFTGQQPAQSGSQRIVGSAGALEFFTPEPTFVTEPEYIGYSGQVKEAIVIDRNSPNRSWYAAFTGGITEATIEFDVTSLVDIYSGSATIGFTTGQELLPTLPPIRENYINHGIYIDNGQYWDYFEVNPFGIRSINRPELAIPIDLTTPKRVRIGINAQNIILTTENGRGIFGTNALNTVVQSGADAKIAFGAIPISGVDNRYPLSYVGISGVAGRSQWDNIKILNGTSQLTVSTGLAQYYVTEPQTGYTQEYDPGIPVNNWNLGTIGFIPYRGGGSTTVTAQYSGTAGWTDSASVTLTNQGSPETIDLTSTPIYFNSRFASTHNRVFNPLRFKIVQQSNGRDPAPPIDYISISASSERSYLDILPNWKPINMAAAIQMAPRQLFTDEVIAYQSNFSTFVLNSPLSTGQRLNTFITNEDTLRTGDVYAGRTVDIVYAGANSTAIRNFSVSGLQALQGTRAASLLGGDVVTNCFFNSTLDGRYVLVTGDAHYVANRSFGSLAEGLYMVPSYTGRSVVNYEKKQVFRTEDQADRLRTNTVEGRSQRSIQSFVQSVRVPSQASLTIEGSTGLHDASCGFEVDIAQGICSGKLMFNMDLQVEIGTGIYLYATGLGVSGSPTMALDATQYRDFRNISMPIVSNDNHGEIRVGVVVTPGTRSTQAVTYNVDNVSLTPYRDGFVYCDNVPTFFHESGLLRGSVAGTSTVAAVRSCTVAGLDVKLNAYPSTESSIILQKKRSSDNRGYRIFCDTRGYLSAQIDSESQAWATGADALHPYTGSVYTTQFSSDYRMPLDRWLNVCLVHQVETYEKLGYVNYSGAAFPTNFASTNRTYLLVDGYPVGAVDMMTGWNNGSHVQFTDRTPYVSYLCDGVGRVTLASGILMEFDAVQLAKPAIADTESDGSLKVARITTPYFVPDIYMKPTSDSTVKNFLIPDGLSSTIGTDYYLGSIYNFDGPGYTNWDHGPWRNHLLYYGAIQKLSTSPYDPDGTFGYGSTYIPSGSYALAKYSSAMERQYNSQNNLANATLYSLVGGNVNGLKVLGWVKPYTSGQDFFHVMESDSNFAGRKLSLGFSEEMKLVLHLSSGNTDIWARTGSVSHNLTGWNWVGFYGNLGDYTGHGTTGIGTAILVSQSGIDGSFINDIVGINYGFQYYGRSGSPSRSCTVFGLSAPVSFGDFSVSVPYAADLSYSDYALHRNVDTSNKSGRFTTLMEGASKFEGRYEISGFRRINMYLSGDYLPRDTMYWVAAHNSYDNSFRLNGGIHLFDDEPFRHVESYYLDYDTSPVRAIVGEMLSPIKIGNQVPFGAINLARISSPSFNSDSSISSVDLADLNTSNLLAYKGGEYTINRSNGVKTTFTSTGSYKGINAGLIANRYDYEYSGQVYSQNIDLTPVSISSIDSTVSHPAYYYYLIGRGRYAVSVPEAAAHSSTLANERATGDPTNAYVSNLDKIKNTITLRNSNGEELPFDAYPYDVISSPYTISDLKTAIQSGMSINLDGVIRVSGVSNLYTGTLPNQVFSVLLTLNKNNLASDDSVWVHYPAYDLQTNKVIQNKKEIVNASPIMRKNLDDEIAMPGRYTTVLDQSSLLYTVKIFGVDSDYTSQL